MRNPILYKRLQTMPGGVRVSREGREDEDYRICCPFCGDTRHRLYISCKWGALDPVTGMNNLTLIQCYNENCFQLQKSDQLLYDERVERHRQFLLRVYRGFHGAVVLNGATKTSVIPKGPLAWPGKVIRLDKLYEKRPEHPAVTYMQRRGFDPIQLGKEYGFVFCDKVTDSQYAPALGTILMPIYLNGELYSWISRYIGEDIGGKKIKKYYNCPNRPLQSVGYRIQDVAKYSTVVIVEGVLDCIKTGPFATCLFTRSLNKQMLSKIVRGLQRYGEEGTAVIMLDPDQSEKERQRRVPHHIEVVAEAFAEYIPNIVKVYLPSGTDPGSLSSGEIMQHIQYAAAKAHIKLNFKSHESSSS